MNQEVVSFPYISVPCGHNVKKKKKQLTVVLRNMWRSLQCMCEDYSLVVLLRPQKFLRIAKFAVSDVRMRSYVCRGAVTCSH